MATRLRLKRDRCEACGASLFSGRRWCSLHDGTRVIRLCRSCTEDAWRREDAEDRWQCELLEACYQLTPRQTGVGFTDDDDNRGEIHVAA